MTVDQLIAELQRIRTLYPDCPVEFHDGSGATQEVESARRFIDETNKIIGKPKVILYTSKP